MITPIILFLVGLVLLIKGGDWFVDGATGIAHKFHVPDLLIGATVVSIGTTLPEVMVSATSAVSGHGEIAYGNAIGSIICNTALIAAISIAVKPVIYTGSKYLLSFFKKLHSGYFLLCIHRTLPVYRLRYQALRSRNRCAASADFRHIYRHSGLSGDARQEPGGCSSGR